MKLRQSAFLAVRVSCVGCAASQSKRKWSLPFRLGPTRIGTRATFWCIFRSSLPRHRHAAVLRILLARRGRLGAACAAVATVSALAAPAAVCAIEQVLLYCRAVPSAASDDRHHCAACRGGTFHPPPATAPKSLHRGPQHNPPPHRPADDAAGIRWPRVGSARGLPPRVFIGRCIVHEGGIARSGGDPALALLTRARRPGLLPQCAAGGREEGRRLAALLHKVRRVQAGPNAPLPATRAVRPRAAALERLVQQRCRLLQLQVLSPRAPLRRTRARRRRGHVAPRRRAEHPRRGGGGEDASRSGGPAARRARQRAGIAAQPA